MPTRPPLSFLLLLCFQILGLLIVAQTSAADEDAGKANDDGEWDVSSPPGEKQMLLLETDETTWSNLDISPDGRTLVFDMLGDLYTVPITGGDATPLVEGMAWDYQPRFSPDGKSIAFISDRKGGDNLWVMDADGSNPRAITSEPEHLVHNPSWSPDGAYLVAKKSFMSTRSIPAGEIWLFHVGGGNGLQMTERPHGARDQKNQAEPAFSPDGRYVYYSRDTTPGRVWQYGKDSTGQIFSIERLDTHNGDVESFVFGPGGAVRPTPSPDGQYLAFIKRLPGLVSAIYLKDLESGKEWAVFDRFERDLQETSGSEGNAPAFAWTPDNQGLIFWTGGKFHHLNVESRKVRQIPVRIRSERELRKAVRFPVEVSPDRFKVKMLRWAQPSPDGKQVVFQALGRLWIRDLDGGEARRLTHQDQHWELYPAWSRDGKSLAYVTWHDDRLGSVRVLSLADGSEKVITHQPGHYLEPSFSPDGSQVAYRKTTGGYILSALSSLNPGIYLAPADGSEEPNRVLNRGSLPHFGADAERLYFVGGAESGLSLRSVRLDGEDEIHHFDAPQATEARVSPDGKYVAFTEDYDAWVTPFARTGKTVQLSSSNKAIPLARVSKRAGEFLAWSADSQSLHWSMGPQLYSRELQQSFAHLDGAPEELPEPESEGIDLGFSQAAARADGTIALVGARVVTMRGALEGEQEVIEDGVVLVEGHRIARVGSADQIEVPSDAEVFELEGKTIVPGFVDVHAHGPHAREEITPQHNRIQLSNLAFGVTTIHDPSNDTTEIFAAAEMQRAGLIVAPRIYSTGTILYGAKGPGFHASIDDLEDARFHIQRLKDVGAISVKSYQHPRRDQRQQLVEAGRELGIMVIPEGGMKFQHNMSEIVDGHTGIEHSLTVKTAYDDVLQLWSATEVGYTPTLGVSFGGMEGERFFYDRDNVWENERLLRYTPRSMVEPRARRRQTAPLEDYNHIHVASTCKDLMRLGVSVQVGAHGQREGLATHWEMWMFEQGGFTPWEALRSGTLSGAWYVGLDGDIGSIEEGKLADLVVIDGNPLEDLRRSEYVDYTMLGGRLYAAEDMSQLAPDEVPGPELFFQKEGGDTVVPSTRAWAESHARRHSCRH